MKIFLHAILLCGTIYGQTLKEKITLKDGRILKLYNDKTYKFEQKKSTEKKYTYSELKVLLRNKTQLQVKEIMGKPNKVGSNKSLKDDNYEYVDVMNDKLKGDTWAYVARYGRQTGSWDPVLEKYEDLLIYFYKGRVYSLVRNETW